MSNRIRLMLLFVMLAAVALVSAQRRPDDRGNNDDARRRQAVTVKPVSEGGVSVFFSPEGGALDAVRLAISKARRSLDVQAYLLTTKEIAQPLAEAHRRGVKVRVLMDSDNAGDKYSAATYLSNAGVPVWLDAEHKEAHNKVILVDGQTVVTGSFNFTLAAEEQNAENLVVIEGKPKIFAAYQRNFERHLEHGKPYGKPAGTRK